MTRYFCTYFDRNYLPRGLALYQSLRRHCPAFKLWVLCMDRISHEALTMLELPDVHAIALADYERDDQALLEAKQDRTLIEYYFTCSPSLPLFILANYHDVDLITYLDADLFFFADPTPVFEELGARSTGIIGHRFPASFRGLAPDVVPEQEVVRMEKHEWVTTTQRHDHLRGQQRIVAGIVHSTGAGIS